MSAPDAPGDAAVARQAHPGTRRPPPHPARVHPAQVVELVRAHPDRIAVGDRATIRCSDELLRLLMSRYRDAGAPLGRAIHPMTTVPAGLAIDAAIEAVGGYRLEVTTLRYARFSMEAPTSNRRPLEATARVEVVGRRHVEARCVVTEGERTILVGVFGLVRVVRGRASSLADRAAPPSPEAPRPPVATG